MANRVQYGPSAITAGQVAYQGGLGQAQKEQDRWAAEQQRVAFDQAMRQQAFDLQAQQVANAQYDRNRAFGYQIAKDRNAVAMQQQNLEAQLMARMAENQAQRAFDWEKMLAGEQMWQDHAAVQNDYQRQNQQALWDRQSVDSAEKGLADMISQYRKMPLTDEGRQLVHQVEGQFRTAQSQRNNFRDGQYAQILSEIADTFAKKRVEDFVDESPKTFQEMLDSGMASWVQHPVTKEYIGIGSLQNRNGTMQADLIPLPKNNAKESDPTKVPVDTTFGKMGSTDVLDNFLKIDKQINGYVTDRNKIDGMLPKGFSVKPEEYDAEYESLRQRLSKHVLGIEGAPAPIMAPQPSQQSSPAEEQEPELPPVPESVPTLQTSFDLKTFEANPNDEGYFSFAGRLFYKSIVNGKPVIVEVAPD